MPRTTSTIPEDLHHLLKGSVNTGIFENKSDGVRRVLRAYFEHNQQARNAAAVSCYDHDDIPLAAAARLADVSRAEFRTILRDHDITVDPPKEDEPGSPTDADAQTQLTQTDDTHWTPD